MSNGELLALLDALKDQHGRSRPGRGLRADQAPDHERKAEETRTLVKEILDDLASSVTPGDIRQAEKVNEVRAFAANAIARMPQALAQDSAEASDCRDRIDFVIDLLAKRGFLPRPSTP